MELSRILLLHYIVPILLIIDRPSLPHFAQLKKGQNSADGK
jgi:hypothetical protein